MTGQTMDRMKEQAKESAIKQIKYEMAMDAVAAKAAKETEDETAEEKPKKKATSKKKAETEQAPKTEE